MSLLSDGPVNPRTVTVDKNAAHPKATAQMKKDGELWRRSSLLQVKFLNNIPGSAGRFGRGNRPVGVWKLRRSPGSAWMLALYEVDRIRREGGHPRQIHAMSSRTEPDHQATMAIGCLCHGVAQ